MILVLKLAAAQARCHPTRIVLALAAIMASVCAVVWVVSGYDSLVGKFDAFGEEYLGRYDAIVVPVFQKDPTGFGRQDTAPLSERVLEALRADPNVFAAEPMFQSAVRVLPANRAEEMRNLKSDEMPALVGTEAAEAPYPLLEGRWLDPQPGQALEAVISQAAAQRLQVKLGDELAISTRRSNMADLAIIVGIVEVPSLTEGEQRPGERPLLEGTLRRGPVELALYVSKSGAERVLDRPLELSYIGVVLANEVSPRSWSRSFSESSLRDDIGAEAQAMGEVVGELGASTGTQTLRLQSLTATCLSMLVAVFVVLATLSMGVDERARQFALLRAVALTRGQIATLIFVEAALLGLAGWASGLLAGWALIHVVRAVRPDFFPAGATLGFWSLGLTGICAVGATMFSAMGAARKATAIRPLDVTTGGGARPIRAFRWPIFIAGIALLFVNPILAFGVRMPDSSRYAISGVIGALATASGCILLIPALIVLVDRWMTPLVSALSWIHPALLRNQLESNRLRTISATTVLSLGLGSFLAIQIWANSMLRPYLPGEWMPEYLVMLGPRGLTHSQIESLLKEPLVARRKVAPLAVEQVKFATDITGAGKRASVTRQDNCIIIGIESEIAFAKTDPLLDFRFIEGSRDDVREKFQQGRYCVVPDHFQRETGLGVGSRFVVVSPSSPETKLEYEIAGVVAMDGWHLASKGGLRTRSSRAAAMMIAPLVVVQSDFAIDQIRHFWIDQSEESEDADMKAVLTQVFGKVETDGPAPRARVQATSELTATVRRHAGDIIWGLSKLPLILLIITSLGVTNAVMASIFSRRWDFGICRAVGMTRLGLVRLIVAEGVMIGLVACFTSLLFGIVAGYCGTEVTRYVDVHGGLITPLAIPWRNAFLGFCLTFAMCAAAATAPALSIGRREPLQLLSAGRQSL